ncbi:MAG: hypothetical protein RX316_08940 [bacterium]|nr:hypothetical protein [bacterium]
MDGQKIELKIEELEERIAPAIIFFRLGGGNSAVELRIETNSPATDASLITPGGGDPDTFGLLKSHTSGGIGHH